MADIESTPGLIFDLAQPERSPAVPALAMLSNLLVKSIFDAATYPLWRPILHKIGHRDWSEDLWFSTRGVLLALIGARVFARMGGASVW